MGRRGAEAHGVAVVWAVLGSWLGSVSLEVPSNPDDSVILILSPVTHGCARGRTAANAWARVGVCEYVSVQKYVCEET